MSICTVIAAKPAPESFIRKDGRPGRVMRIKIKNGNTYRSTGLFSEVREDKFYAYLKDNNNRLVLRPDLWERVV